VGRVAELYLVRPVKSISSSSDCNDWLHHHIPHRIRAGLAGLSFASEFLPATADARLRTRFAEACLQNAAFEGRMAAIRWLIDSLAFETNRGNQPDRTDGAIMTLALRLSQEDGRLTSIRTKQRFCAECGKAARKQAAMRRMILSIS
jgi:hypothetical protein